MRVNGLTFILVLVVVAMAMFHVLVVTQLDTTYFPIIVRISPKRDPTNSCVRRIVFRRRRRRRAQSSSRY